MPGSCPVLFYRRPCVPVWSGTTLDDLFPNKRGRTSHPELADLARHRRENERLKKKPQRGGTDSPRIGSGTKLSQTLDSAALRPKNDHPRGR